MTWLDWGREAFPRLPGERTGDTLSYSRLGYMGCKAVSVYTNRQQREERSLSRLNPDRLMLHDVFSHVVIGERLIGEVLLRIIVKIGWASSRRHFGPKKIQNEGSCGYFAFPVRRRLSRSLFIGELLLLWSINGHEFRLIGATPQRKVFRHHL